MNDRNFSCEFCQIHSLFYRGIPTADYIYFKIFKKVRITCCTIRNTFSPELSFSFASDRSCMCARCNDHIFSAIFILFALKNLDLSFKFYFFNHIGYPFCPEFFCLLCHSCNQGWSGFPFYNLTRIIFNLVSNCDLTSILTFFDDQNIEPTSSCIQPRRQTGRTCTQNDNVINLTHFTLYLLLYSHVLFKNFLSVNFRSQSFQSFFYDSTA